MVTFFDISGVKGAREYAESIVNTVREPLLVLNKGLKVISASNAFYRVFKVSKKDTENRLIYELGNRQWDIPKLRQLLEEILPKNREFNDFVVEHKFPKIGHRKMLLNARRVYKAEEKTERILLAIEDITDKETSKRKKG